MRRKIYSLLLVAVMLFSLNACGTKTPEVSSKAEEKLVIRADYPMYDTAQELVDASDLVFTGTVKSISYEMLNVKTETGQDSVTGLAEADSTPYTIFEVSVSKIYKGNVASDTVYLKRPGGQFDSTEYILDGATAINENGSYLFTAAEFESSYPSLLNANQAAYDIDAPESISEGNDITLSQIIAIFE